MTKNTTILSTPNCVGGRHGVSLIRRGRKLSLTLHSHGEDSDFPIETVRSFQALDPEFRCRCLEILDAWKFYTRADTSDGSMPFREFIELYPWGKDAFFKKLSRNDQVTPSMVLSILPKEFREEAKASRSLRGERRENKEIWEGGSPFNPELLPRWAKEFYHSQHHPLNPNLHEESRWKERGRSSLYILPQKSFIRRFALGGDRSGDPEFAGHRLDVRASSEKLNQYLRELFERHGNSKFPRSFGPEDNIDSLLGTNDSCVYGTRGKGDALRRATRLRWIRLYWKYQWMKELVIAGYIPVDIPPECCWEYRGSQPLYPRVASVIQYAPDGREHKVFKERFNFYSIRLMETFNDEGKKFYYTAFPMFGSRFDT